MRVKRKIIYLLLIVFILFTLSGCWDFSELDDNGYVVMLGFDEADEKNQLKVTYVIANPQVGTSLMGTVAKNEKANNPITFDAPSFATSRTLANAFLTRKIDFSHLLMIVIGEDLAKSKELPNLMTQLIKSGDIRQNLYVMVSKEPAHEFIRKNKPIMETRIHKYITSLSLLWKESALSPYANFKKYLQVATEPFSSVLMIYGTTEVQEKNKGIGAKNLAGELAREGGDTAEILGAAVFHNGRMVGKITGSETQLTMIIREEAPIKDVKRSFKDPLDPKYFVSVNLTKNSNIKPKLKIDTKKSPLEISVTVPMRVEILSTPSLKDYVENEKNKHVLIKQINKQLGEESNELIKKSQKEYGDIFNFHLGARRQFLTVNDWRNYEWHEKFKTAKVHVKYDVEIQGYGEVVAPVKGE